MSEVNSNSNIGTLSIEAMTLPNGMSFKGLSINLNVQRTDNGLEVETALARQVCEWVKMMGEKALTHFIESDKERDKHRAEIEKAREERQAKIEQAREERDAKYNDARTKACEAEFNYWNERANREFQNNEEA